MSLALASVITMTIPKKKANVRVLGPCDMVVPDPNDVARPEVWPLSSIPCPFAAHEGESIEDESVSFGLWGEDGTEWHPAGTLENPSGNTLCMSSCNDPVVGDATPDASDPQTITASFEDDDDEGWSCDQITRCGEYGNICGGYTATAGGHEIEKTFQLSEGVYTVSLDLIKIDSWDFEHAYVSVNGQTCWSMNNVHHSRGSNVCGMDYPDEKFPVTGCQVTLGFAEMPKVSEGVPLIGVHHVLFSIVLFWSLSWMFLY